MSQRNTTYFTLVWKDKLSGLSLCDNRPIKGGKDLMVFASEVVQRLTKVWTRQWKQVRLEYNVGPCIIAFNTFKVKYTKLIE